MKQSKPSRRKPIRTFWNATAGIAFIAMAGSTPALAPIEVVSGDLESYLVGVPIPSHNTSPDVDMYVPPNPAERATFAQALDHFVAGRIQSGADAAEAVNYRTIIFNDSPRDDYKIVLREKSTDTKYRGLFAISLTPTRDLVVESPHPLFDGTRAQAINIYIETGARAFMQSGTHRNNSTTVSPCDGTQSNGDPYYISDMAHATDSFFQVAHERLAAGYPESLAFSVHGMSSPSANTADADVVMSNGTTGNISVFSDSWSRQVAARMNELRTSGALGRSRSAASHQTLGEVLPLSGSTNTQGRQTNGSADACTISVSSAPLPERFLHMEQSPAVRASESSWAFVIQTYQELFAALADTTADIPPPLGLVAQWPLDGNGVEVIAARDATLVGGVSASTDRTTTASGALAFNGTNANLSVPDFEYAGSDCGFSYSFWFETTTSSPSNLQYIISHGSVGSAPTPQVNIPSSIHLYVESATGQFRVRFTLEDGRHWSLNAGAPATGLADGSWHHAVFAYSFDDGPALYIDGQFAASEPTLAGRCFNPENDIVIGARTDISAGGRYFGSSTPDSGRLDDIRIYNRALSLADVQDIFEETVAGLDGTHWIID